MENARASPSERSVILFGAIQIKAALPWKEPHRPVGDGCVRQVEIQDSRTTLRDVFH